MKTTFVMAAILATGLGGAAFAQGMDDMGPGMMPGFATLDTDGDGQITPAEVEARQAARFAAADADGSGGLSVAEMVAMAEAMRVEALTARMTERVARIDDDADGEVQATEYAARMPAPELMFDRLDTDNSDGISAEEFDAGIAEMAERRGDGDRGPRGGRHGEDGHGWMFWRNGSQQGG
jgi:hypothetical protein